MLLGLALACQERERVVGRLSAPAAGEGGSSGADSPVTAGSGNQGTAAVSGSAPGGGTGGAAGASSVMGKDPTELAVTTGCGTVRLAVTASDVYWTESASGRVMTVPIAGGTAREVATAQSDPGDIAVDASGVYWVNRGNGSRVMKKPLPPTDSAPSVLKQGTGAEGFLALAVRDGVVYYSQAHDVHAISTDENVTGDDVVGTAINYDVNPPDGEPSGNPAALAVTETTVYWTTAQRFGVESDDIQPGIAGYRELGQSQMNLLLEDIAADGIYAYWAKGEFLVRARAGTLGDFTVTTTPDASAVAAFAISEDDVYLATESGDILVHALTPEDPVEPASLLVVGQPDVTAVAVDTARVYWASGCAIRSVAR